MILDIFLLNTQHYKGKGKELVEQSKERSSAFHYTSVVSKVKLATIVEDDPKAPFSIATTPRCRGGRYSIPRIAPLYPWTVPYNAEC